MPASFRLDMAALNLGFNLVSDTWLPVLDAAGAPSRISLTEAFSRADEWIDLDLPPAERVSVIRLLVCSAQAALGAPEDKQGWGDFGDDFEAKVPAYLEAHRGAFALFGAEPRFLQRRPADSAASVMKNSKLWPHLATNNNPTLFDHAGGEERVFSAADLALALLAFQNFSAAFGQPHKGIGPCIEGNMLHTFIRGATLRETILRNCLDQHLIDENYPSGMGRPLWEMIPQSSNDGVAVRNATLTYLGRLVPLLRPIWLKEDGVHFQIGRERWEYPPFKLFREPSSTELTNDKGDRFPLGAKIGRAVWRELHNLDVKKRGAMSSSGAPLAIRSHSRELSDRMDIWIGAVVVEDSAKLWDVVESTFHLPPSFFQEGGLGCYAEGIKFANSHAWSLWRAVEVYGEALRSHDLSSAGAKARSKRGEKEAKGGNLDEPQRRTGSWHFWNALEQNATLLMHLASDPRFDGNFQPTSRDPWSLAVRASAKDAYAKTCPRVTARQFEAYAQGRRFLFPRSKDRTHRPTDIAS